MFAGAVVLLGLLQAQPPLERVRELVAAGKLPEAQEALARLDFSQPGVAHLAGVVHFSRRQYAQAISDLTAAAAAEKESTPAWRESVSLIGRSYYLTGRLLDALPWLEKARAGGPAPVELLYMLGNCYVQARNPDKSRATFAGMFGLAPDSAGAYLLNGQMMIRQELESAAARELRRALELDARIPEAHFLLGELAIYRGELEDGISELRREIALNPNFAAAYWRLGDIYVRQERWDDAVPQLQKSIWLNQTFSGPYILLGKAYLKRRELANAEGVLRRALQMDPQNSSAHYLLGQTLIQAGRDEEGKRLLVRAQELKQSR